jgi:hypothetical protein
MHSMLSGILSVRVTTAVIRLHYCVCRLFASTVAGPSDLLES